MPKATTSWSPRIYFISGWSSRASRKYSSVVPGRPKTYSTPSSRKICIRASPPVIELIFLFLPFNLFRDVSHLAPFGGIFWLDFGVYQADRPFMAHHARHLFRGDNGRCRPGFRGWRPGIVPGENH